MNVERTTPADIHRQIFWWLFTVVALIALAVRVYHISLRPFHSDEGVNFHFLKAIGREGFYRYSHENYHGPAYFYLTFLLTKLVGMNDFGMRASAILMGWGLLPLLLLLLRVQTRFFVLSAACLVGFSSSQIFQSRYSIHEPLFVWSTALLAFSVFLWHQTRDARYHYLSGLALGLLIATKETFIISLFCVFFAYLALGDHRSAFKDLWQQRTAIIGGLFITVVVILLLFSGGLQWPGGIREMFLAVPQWIGRNESDVGHFKPFIYYTELLLGKGFLQTLEGISGTQFTLKKSYIAAAEPQFWFLILLPLVTVCCFPSGIRQIAKKENAAGRFFLIWGFLSWLVYSLVNYKTPWLIINITLPLSLALAWMLFRVSAAFSNRGLIASTTLMIIATGISAQSAYLFNFKHPYGSNNPFSYVHTHEGMMRLLSQIEQETAAYGKRNILIATHHYWPLPYYLRDYKGNTGYLATDDPTGQLDNYDILILDSRTKWKHPPDQWVRRYYRLSDVQESFTYFRIEKK